MKPLLYYVHKLSKQAKGKNMYRNEYDANVNGFTCAPAANTRKPMAQYNWQIKAKRKQKIQNIKHTVLATVAILFICTAESLVDNALKFIGL